MYKYIFAVILMLTGFAFAENSKSGEAKTDSSFSGKIGIIDVDRITMESKSLKNIVKDMESTVKTKQDELDGKINEYQEKKNSLDQQRSVLKQDEIEKREKELLGLKESISDFKYELNKILKRSERESIEPMLDKIMGAVNQVAKEKQLDAVLRTDVLLYYNRKCDITDDVIRILDSQPEEIKSQEAANENKEIKEKKVIEESKAAEENKSVEEKKEAVPTPAEKKESTEKIKPAETPAPETKSAPEIKSEIKPEQDKTENKATEKPKAKTTNKENKDEKDGKAKDNKDKDIF